MPRSPSGKTSGRWSRKIRNISAVQRPMPFTCVSAAIDLFVGHRVHRVERHRAAAHLVAQVAQVAGLLAADAGGPELLVGDAGKRLRRQRGARACTSTSRL